MKDETKNNSLLLTGAIGITVGLLNGIFGSGGGTIAVPAMQKFLKVDTHKSHATAIAVILPLSCVSLIVYMKNGIPDIMTIIMVSAGGAAGGYIGARLLKKLKSASLHKLFGAFMVIASLRMIF